MTYERYPNPVPLWVINLTGFCALVTLSLLLTYLYTAGRWVIESPTFLYVTRSLPAPETLAENPFSTLPLEAKAAIVFDVSNNTAVYTHNSEAQLPLASITKLMTAVVSSETLPPYTAVPIVKRDVDYDPKLKVGEQWPLRDLLEYTLLTSSNSGADSAAVITARFLDGEGSENASTSPSPEKFIAAMNEKAKEIGLVQTYFLNGSGTDTYTNVGGAYGSARDVAKLLSYMLEKHADLLELTRRTQTQFKARDGRTIEAKNTNTTVETIPGILASKTGLTDLAGGNLAIAFDASFGEPFIIVVLGSSQEGRFTDVSKLFDATITYLGSSLRRTGNVETMP